LLVNISKKIKSDHHIQRKEEGFIAYFNNHNETNVINLNIKNTDYLSVEEHISFILVKHPDIKIIFVTNSRVSKVAQYIELVNREDILLIGYDFIKENIEYLEKGIIDFLICEKPQEQAYRGIMTLYQHLTFAVDIQKNYFMPIDIITKENYQFYRN